MKYLISILFVLLLISCKSSDEYINVETIDTVVRAQITEVRKAKYSDVYATFMWENKMVKVDNELQGYYYKEYPLKPGDSIILSIKVRKYEWVKDQYHKTNIHKYQTIFEPDFDRVSIIK